ncbi:unnamed protein product, partial [Choristocarpus tenellus]
VEDAVARDKGKGTIEDVAAKNVLWVMEDDSLLLSARLSPQWYLDELSQHDSFSSSEPIWRDYGEHCGSVISGEKVDLASQPKTGYPQQCIAEATPKGHDRLSASGVGGRAHKWRPGNISYLGGGDCSRSKRAHDVEISRQSTLQGNNTAGLKAFLASTEDRVSQRSTIFGSSQSV